MAKRLGMLVGVFVLAIGIAAYIWFFGKPASKQANPLKNVKLDDVSRIAMNNQYGRVVLERDKNRWLISEPFKDVVDPSIPDEIVNALKNFTLGEQVSVNPKNYAQFHVDEAQAAHAQIFISGDEKPVMDGYVGKASSGYENCYFRFAASTPVYIATDLPEYQFRREPKGFRLTKVLPGQITDPLAIKIVEEKSTLDLVRSSVTWTRRGSERVIPGVLVTPLASKLNNLNAADFPTPALDAAALGFDKPFLSVTVETTGGTESFVVGKKGPALASAAGPGPQTRYAKTAGRDAPYLLTDDVLIDLLSSTKTIP